MQVVEITSGDFRLFIVFYYFVSFYKNVGQMLDKF